MAGPVVACALACPANYDIKKEGRRANLAPLKDSKKLTSKQREEWDRWLKNNKHIRFALASASPAIIDNINISAAANRCAWRGFSSIFKKIKTDNIQIFLDGGLHLKNKEFQKNFKATTTPKSDENNPIVAAASVLAKVARDSYMARMERKFPGYGFLKNVGYGTSAHIAAIYEKGICPLHRLTFLSRILENGR